MSRYIVIPDSFKGSLSSRRLCTLIAQRIRLREPEAEILSFPVADGGEGSVDCFLSACGGERIAADVHGPYFEEMHAEYGILPDGTAVIEMAACAGLPLVGERLSPSETTTYGVGELILCALRRGCRRILLCLGGSATNDGGAGMAAALGYRFYRRGADGAEETFIPTGGTLSQLERIDAAHADGKLREADFTVMCDVTNPLVGPRGAAAVFAPQKGASPDEIRLLDAGLCRLAAVIRASLGAEIADLPGAGAAGGMGGGAAAFLGAGLCRGIDAVLAQIRFREHLPGTDLVITGEGRIDAQSACGKVVGGVARCAAEYGVPTAALVGEIGEGADILYGEGVSGIFCINRRAVPLDEAMEHTEENVLFAVDNLLRYTAALRRAGGTGKGTSS